jgi:hypothetical protein
LKIDSEKGLSLLTAGRLNEGITPWDCRLATFLRRSQQDAWQHETTTRGKAGQQVQGRVAHNRSTMRAKTTGNLLLIK